MQSCRCNCLPPIHRTPTWEEIVEDSCSSPCRQKPTELVQSVSLVQTGPSTKQGEEIMSAQPQCLIRSVVCPHSSMGLLLSLIQMNTENKVHSNTWSGQTRKKQTYFPHLGCSIMRGCHNKWMAFWSAHGTALALGRPSEEQLRPTILP